MKALTKAVLLLSVAIGGPLSLTVTSGFAAELKAGTAKVVITNQTPRVMTNGRVSSGVLKDIYARALVLNDGRKRLVIITYDLNCLDVATPILRTRLKRELSIDPAYVVLLATHNHNGPIQIVPDNFDYGRWLADKLYDLVKEAMGREVGPVRLLFGSGHGYFIQSSGNAPVDYEIQLLKVMKGEQVVALLFNHGTHPLQGSIDKVGPGHPGWAMDEIEAKIPGSFAMYSDACGGNQFPRLRGRIREELAAAQKQGTEVANSFLLKHTKSLAHELAVSILDIAGGELRDVTGPITSSMQTLSLPLRDPIPRAEAEVLAKNFPADTGFVPYPNKFRGTNWVRMLLYWYERGLPFPKWTTDLICTDDTYLIHKSDRQMLDRYDYSIHDELPCIYEEVIVAKLGPMPLVAMQGEVCAPIGMRIKDAFRHEIPIMVFSYMGEHNLYIPTRELVRLDAYQSKVIQIQYASPVGWAPEVEDEMVGGVIKMVEDIRSTAEPTP